MAKALPALYAPNFTEVRLAPGRMAKTAGWSDLRGKDRPGKPWLNGLPRLIFVNDLSDLFSKAVPFEFIHDEVVATAASAKGRRHVYMLLTKQPSRMVKFAEWLSAKGIKWPENLWAGTSVTSNKTARRIDALVKVPAKFKYLSLEPLREFVDLSPWLFCERCSNSFSQCGRGAYLTPLENACGGPWFRECDCEQINLVIVGGESRQGQHKPTPFDLRWARQYVKDCKDAGVACFVKQLGSRPFDSSQRISIDGPESHSLALDLKDRHGGDWWEWDEDLRVREMPALEGVAR